MRQSAHPGSSPIAKKIAHIAGPHLAAAVILVQAGCGGAQRPTTYPVTGKVLLPDGTPLTSGRVMFVSPQAGLTYGGTINSDGTFTLKTGEREGAPEGTYQVRIEVVESDLPQAKGRAAKASAILPFAQKYTDEDASKLTAAVKPQNSGNDFEFRLTK